MIRLFTVTFLLTVSVVLTSCSITGFRQAIGVSRNAPDEFMVMPRDKLKLPPGPMALPAPTEKQPGHLASGRAAQTDIFGKTDIPQRENTPLENSLFQKVGYTEPGIRSTVDDEYKNKSGVFGTKRGGSIEKILDPFGYNSANEPVVDGQQENQRIRAALMNGRPVDSQKVISKLPTDESFKQNEQYNASGSELNAEAIRKQNEKSKSIWDRIF